MYKCFGCGAGGSIFRFVMEMERLSFPEAIRKLGERVGVEINEEQSDLDRMVKSGYSIMAKTNQLFFSYLIGKSGNKARKILKERAFTREICETWDIGFAPEGYILSGDSDHHSRFGLTYDNGTPRFTNRIMFGIRNEAGHLVGFSGRTIVDHPAKYLNSPDSLIFKKGQLFYGLDKAKRSVIDGGKIVIVEGQIDCIRCHLHGVTNAVSVLGTGFTAAHGQIIRRLCEEAVLVFDSDKAGQEAARKAFAGLASLGIRVRAFMLPPKTDPDEFILGGGNLVEAIEKAKLYPEALAEYLQSSTIEGKQIAMKKVGFALSVMEDGIERDELTVHCAKLLGIKSGQLRKQAAQHGGHDALPTSKLGKQTTETMKQLLAHLVYCGKDKAKAYNWKLISDSDIQTIMDTEYEPSNPNSLATLFSKLDSSVEAAVAGMTCQDVEGLDIHGIYRSMIETEIRKRAEGIASGGKAIDLLPLLDTLKGL